MFSIPPHLAVTEYGSYIMSIKNNMIKIIGHGKLIGYDGIGLMRVELIADPEKILATSIQN